MSRSIDRHLPLIVIVLGLFTHIVWTVINSLLQRFRLTLHEVETFCRLSGKIERPTE